MSYLGDGAHLGALSATMAQTLTQLHTQLPAWLAQTLPTPETFQHSLMGLLREHGTSQQHPHCVGGFVGVLRHGGGMALGL